jgi:hypothetical protein
MVEENLSSKKSNNNNNNPWRYSSDEPWPAEQPPLAVLVRKVLRENK